MLQSPTKVSFGLRLEPCFIFSDFVVAGIYYEHGKEPPAEGPPKLHLLVESNDEYRVRSFSPSYVAHADLAPQAEQAVREIKRLLIEASAAALQAEMRNPTATVGRYSVV